MSSPYPNLSPEGQSLYDPGCSPEANGVARQCLLWVLEEGEPILPIDQERFARLIQGAMDQWAANQNQKIAELKQENDRLLKQLDAQWEKLKAASA